MFSLKLNLLLDIIELTLLQNKAPFHLFVWLDITLSILLFRSKLFSDIAERSNFLSYFRCKAKFNLQGKKVTENKLKSFDYGFKILIPVYVKANFSFTIHQSKCFVMILVNMFDVSSLILATKQWCWAVPHPDVIWYRFNGMGTQKKCAQKVILTFFHIYFT